MKINTIHTRDSKEIPQTIPICAPDQTQPDKSSEYYDLSLLRWNILSLTPLKKIKLLRLYFQVIQNFMLGPYLGPWLLKYRAEIFIFILLGKF